MWWRAFLRTSDTQVPSPLNLGKCSTWAIFICLNCLFYGFPNLTEHSEIWVVKDSVLSIILSRDGIAGLPMIYRCAEWRSVQQCPHSHTTVPCWGFSSWSIFGTLPQLCVNEQRRIRQWVINYLQGSSHDVRPDLAGSSNARGLQSRSMNGYRAAWGHGEHLSLGTNHFISRVMNEIITSSGMA